MDPRDRLWHDLVFVRCDASALLSLRAVCRTFRAQLRDSRLWLPLTMVVSRMRYDERLAGWAGVERAMKREDVTRANCDAGRYTRGHFDLPMKGCTISLDGAVIVDAGHLLP